MIEEEVIDVLAHSKYNLSLLKNLFLDNPDMLKSLDESTITYSKSIDTNVKSLISKIDSILLRQTTTSKGGKNAETKVITIYDVIHFVCEFYKVSPQDIKSKTHRREIVATRQMIMYFCRKIFNQNYTLKFIGKQVGGLNYSTVNASIKTIENILNTDKQKKMEFDAIKSKLDNLYS